MSDYQIPAEWRDSFHYFSEDSLHLFAKLYLNNPKAHSRELIIESLWSYANRSEFCQNSLNGLDHFDTEVLLLLYLGLENVENLAQSLPQYSYIEICLRLLHLQERLLILRQPSSNSKADPHSLLLLSKAEKTEKLSANLRGAHFAIAPHVFGYLQQHLNLCNIFEGILLDKSQVHRWKHEFSQSLPPLSLSSELVLANALFFVQENIQPTRKMSKTQTGKYQECFSKLDVRQMQALRELVQNLGLIYCENDQTHFCEQSFAKLWAAPYYERLLSLQALISGLPNEFFAKLLGIWPQHLVLPASQIQSLLTLAGIREEETENTIQTMLDWHILCILPEQLSEAEDMLYALSPKIYESIGGQGSQRSPSSQDSENQAEQTAVKLESTHNRLSENWELYCDLRHPEHYIQLLLCARIERFDDLSLFHIEKQRFQSYFNAEDEKFQNFMHSVQKIQHTGIDISEFICKQWEEWFHDCTRFQLFKGCLLVCQADYNQLIVRLFSEDSDEDSEGAPAKNLSQKKAPKLAQKQGHGARSEMAQTAAPLILGNPQPGVFYLNPESSTQWRSKLSNAEIQPSEPFTRNACTEITEFSLQFPIQGVLEQARVHTQASDSKIAQKPQRDTWADWPTEFGAFAKSRNLLLHKCDFSQLHIHCREARGVDYTTKRNLLQSLLTARNRMAIITVAEGKDFDLISYTILPLSLEGPKESPRLLALELRQEKILDFSVKSITRVNEVFYSLINVCLLNLLPLPYICQLEGEYQSKDSTEKKPDEE